jgi:hypothetical protein
VDFIRVFLESNASARLVLIYITWSGWLVVSTPHAYNGAVLVPAGVFAPAVKRETRARLPATGG